VLQKPDDRITECWKRAAAAECRAAKAKDVTTRADCIEIAAHWRSLARSYQFAQRFEQTLRDFPESRGLERRVIGG
jgi:hypothetical protein